MGQYCATVVAPKQRLSDAAGFSLIELLVIVAILGVLGGVAASTLWQDAPANARLNEQYELAFSHTQETIFDAQVSGYKHRLWLEKTGIYQQQSSDFSSHCATTARSALLVPEVDTESSGSYGIQVFQCSFSSGKCDVDVSTEGLCIRPDGSLLNPYVVRFQSATLTRHFTIYSTGLVARGLGVTASGNAEGVYIQ